jgi:hypothetical protein
MGTLTHSALTLRMEVLRHQDELDRELAAGFEADARAARALPMQAEAVRDAQVELEQLRSVLLSPGEVSSQGLALASLLLHGPDSPIHAAAPYGTVAAQARAALRAMHPE